MKKRSFNLNEGAPLSAGGGGGGRMMRGAIAAPKTYTPPADTPKAPQSLNSSGRLYKPGSDPMTDRAAAGIQKSIDERGGYPTRGGVPMKTKMQERMDTRKAAQGSPDYSKRMERKKSFGFSKGGKVK